MTTRCSSMSLAGALAGGLLALTACTSDSGNATDAGPGGDASGGSGGAGTGGTGGAGTGGGGASGAGGGGAAGTGGGGAAGRGGSGGAGGSAGGGGAGTPAKFGQVTVSNITFGAAAFYTATATFQSSVEPVAGCTIRTVGACQVIRCATSDGGVIPPASGPAPHVGAISITGGVAPVTLTPGSDGKYPPVNGNMSFWSGAARIMFAAAGGTVPAFPATAVDAPQVITDSKINGSTPAAPPARTRVPISGGLRVTWTGGSGDIGLILGQRQGGNILSMPCVTPVSGGSFAFPAMVVNELMPGEATLSLSQISAKNVTAGEYAVSLSLATNPNPGLFALTAE